MARAIAEESLLFTLLYCMRQLLRKWDKLTQKSLIWQAFRLCGRDYGGFVRHYQGQLRTFCGIEVDLSAMENALENGSAISPNSVQQ